MKKGKGGLKVTVKGLDELNRKINNMPSGARRSVGRELSDITLDLEGESSRRAPIDIGDLRGSSFSETDGIEGTVGFTEPYALVQHERMDFNHPTGGEAKYLENPFKERVNRYIKAIGNAIKRGVT